MKRLGKLMRNMQGSSTRRLLVALLLAGATSVCTSETATEVTGNCQPDPAVDCSAKGMSAESANLAGYTCTGTARPDQDSTYIDGVPQGLVCADKPASADGSRGYCCTNFTTHCSYNPTATCVQPGTFGYQCLGADRPEALNPTIGCDQGVREDNLINYCCSGAGITANCTQSDSIGCLPGMTGWICPKGTQPTAEDLGANKSRADLYYLLCPVPKQAPNPKYETLCCYVPSLVPAGGTCQQDMKAAGCTPGQFGISCFGQDKPGDNFSRLSCPDSGVPGQTEQGYPATVYCCDFLPGN